jgi:hypothetical protein
LAVKQQTLSQFREVSMKKPFLIGLTVVFLLSAACTKKEGPEVGAGTTPSSPFDSSLAQLKEAMGKNDHAGALSALRSTFEVFWEKTPLLLNNVKFVMSESASYGIYTPKATEEFAPDEVIYLYLEPVGQTLKKNEQGQYDFGFTADFALEDETGKVLGGQKGFVNPSFTSWNFNTEIALTFNFTFSGLQAGKYKIVLSVKDVNSAKTAAVNKVFTIV